MAKPSAAPVRHNGSPIHRRLDLLDRVFGRGPTYSLKVQNEILEGTPEFLFRGVLLGKDSALGQRCANALEYLDRSGPILAELEREVEALTKERLRG